MKIVLCDQTHIQKYELGVATVLDVIGHPEALVTDECTLCDFMLEASVVSELSRMVGRQLTDDTPLWMIGKWLEGGE